MLLINYQIISLKQILCVAKKILRKHYSASQNPTPPKNFAHVVKLRYTIFLLIRTIFFQKIKLCHAYGFLALCQNLEKANDPILRIFPDRRKDEQAYFIGPFRLPPRVQKHKTDAPGMFKINQNYSNHYLYLLLAWRALNTFIQCLFVDCEQVVKLTR